MDETEPTHEERKFVEEIDSLLSCGNPQSAFAYDQVALLIRTRVAAKVREVGATVKQLHTRDPE